MEKHRYNPLASRMRPRTIKEYVGQTHLLGPGKPLEKAISEGHLHSMILWGPPGTGKTTLAYLLAQSVDAALEEVSAVLAGVKDIREVVARAAKRLDLNNQATILFVDEVHRFNKAQQDAFLPHVEAGTITLIGATTENPSFQLNNALLSRARVYVLQPLDEAALAQVLHQALMDQERGLAQKNLQLTDEVSEQLIQYADGDARRLLGALEILADFSDANHAITVAELATILGPGYRRFDHHGEEFYDQISALHKSVRGSDPDAALYWFARMIDGGCDPHYIARRVLRMASEDIGNADPRGLDIALSAWQTYERLGSPEGELALAQAIAYLAVAAKSNAVYSAFGDAMQDAKRFGSLPVPLHLRNAPTQLMKSLDYGKNYRYAHDEQNAFAAGENYFPEKMGVKRYYHPVNRGLEIKIKEKLDKLHQANGEKHV